MTVSRRGFLGLLGATALAPVALSSRVIFLTAPTLNVPNHVTQGYSDPDYPKTIIYRSVDGGKTFDRSEVGAFGPRFVQVPLETDNVYYWIKHIDKSGRA